MPRLTYWPSSSSCAARAASWVRVRAMSVPPRAGRPAFDALAFQANRPDHALDEDARRVDLLGQDLAGLDQLLHLGDRDAPGHRAERVEVARGLAEEEVAVPVADRGAHQREVGDDPLLQHVVALAERADL